MYNKIFKMTKEQLRMQMLSGIITEGEYKAMLNEDESIDAQIAALQKQIELLQKKKQTGGKVQMTKEQLNLWKQKLPKLYKENSKFEGQFADKAAEALFDIIFGDRTKRKDYSSSLQVRDGLANELGFKDYDEFDMEVFNMLDDLGYDLD